MIRLFQPVEEQPKTKSKKRKSVTWNNEEDVINPEDVDPSIGKFRNSCSVTIIPAKVFKNRFNFKDGVLSFKKSWHHKLM